MNWPDYKDKCRKYFWFSKKEWHHFVILSFLFAFIFSFNEWGAVSFDFASGIQNFVLAMVIVALSVFAHHAAQRLVSLKVGLRPENFIWWPGILIAAILIIFTNGVFMFFAGSYFVVHMLEKHRLGRHRHGINMRTWGYIALFGPLANVVLAAVAAAVNLGLGSAVLEKFVLFNFLFALYQTLPFPPLDGSRMFFASRLSYAFFAGVIYSYLMLVFLLGISGMTAILVALAVGAGCWVGCYIFFEREAMPF